MDGHTHVNTNASYAFTTCNSNKHINLNANRYVHHLKTTFISGSNRADCMYRAVVSRGALPEFGSSVNPIPTRGGRLCPSHYC